MAISIWQLMILLGGAFILLAPCVAALASKKARGWDKALWFLLSFTLSWVGYAGYYFIKVRSSANTSPADGLIRPKRT